MGWASKARCHIKRDVCEAAFLHVFAVVYDVRLGQLLVELGAELADGGQLHPFSRLHLYRIDIVSVGEALLLDEEIDFHTVAGVLLRGAMVEEQLVPTCHKHLRHKVFDQHTLIDFQLV